MLRGRTVSTLGDPRWISASPHFATYAPLVVLSLLVLAIIQVALGIVWVAAMQDSLTLYVISLFFLFLSNFFCERGTSYALRASG
jgi:hypothetical protein